MRGFGRVFAGCFLLFGLAACGGGGSDPALPAEPDPAGPARPALYDFNGTWNLATQVVRNECDRDVFDGEIRIAQNGTTFVLTRMRNGQLQSFGGTCDPAAATFTFSYRDRYGIVTWNGAGVTETFMRGSRTLPGPGGCVSLFTWTAALVSR